MRRAAAIAAHVPRCTPATPAHASASASASTSASSNQQLTGRAVELVQSGERGRPSALRLNEARPVRALGQRDVRVRVLACGVCHRDVLDAKGAFPFSTGNVVGGHEAAGVVDAVGEAVTEFGVGDRVLSLHWTSCGKCAPCQRGESTVCEERNESFLGITADGGYAEYLVAGELGLAHVPPALGFSAVEAATLMCTYGTVWHSFVKRGRLQPGEEVLITGASGGVGTSAVQLCRALGCRVVAVTTSPQKIPFLKSIGADEVIVVSDGRLPGGLQVDAALECVGEPLFEQTLRSLRPGGRLCLVGNVTVGKVPLKLGLPIILELSIIGGDSISKGELAELFRFMQRTKIRPHVSQTLLRLDDVARAHQLLVDKQVEGRLVVRVSDDDW